LKAYLQAAGIDEGESLSSFRPGGGIELAMVGCTMFDIMELADWKSAKIANHYLKLREVLGDNSSAHMLARLGGSAQSKAGLEAYRKANSLRAAPVLPVPTGTGFLCLPSFPSLFLHLHNKRIGGGENILLTRSQAK
jgi:hypothetical protein